MELKLMTGGFVIALLYAILQFTIIGVTVYHGYKIYKNYKKHKTVEKTLANSKYHLIAIGILVFLLTVFNPAIAPKREIATINSRPQIEYNRGFEVEIVTPPPRTERMDGFRSLKDSAND